jgi:hypothetical protein
MNKLVSETAKKTLEQCIEAKPFCQLQQNQTLTANKTLYQPQTHQPKFARHW